MTLTQIKPAGLSTPVDLADNAKIRLGTSNDLQIYHDGSHSYIANSTGNLYINAPNYFHLGVSNGGDKYITALENGVVELYYDGSKKFETTTTGAKIIHTGNAALEIVGGEGYHAQIYMTADEGDDANDKWLIDSQDAGKFVLYNYSNGSSWEKSIIANAAGAVELYYDNDKKFETNSLGATVTGKLGIGTSSPSDNLEISSTVPTIRLTDTDGGPSYSQIKGPGNGDLRISCDVGNTSSSASEIQFDIHDSNKMVIQSTGNIGIGTTTPNHVLDVQGANNTTFDHVAVLSLKGTDAYNSGNAGSGINFGGRYNSGGSTSTFAQISGIKENTGDGEYDGALTFGVRNDTQGVNIERMRIDSSGRLLLGTTTEGFAEYDDLTIATSGHTGITIRSGASSEGSIAFANGTSGSTEYKGLIQYNHSNNYLRFLTDATERIRLDSTGNLQISAGDLKVASGRGIDFSAVPDGSRTIHSNLFDDYEEGTWTPTIGGSTTQGSATMATQAGKYVKAGKLVTVSCYIGWNSFTGSGALNIYGLPFTCWNDAHAGAVMTKDLTFPSGAFYLSTHTWANVSYFRLYSSASNATWNYVTCDSTGNLICTMTYFAS